MTAEAWRRLAVAVLLQAVKDAMGKGFKAEPGDCEDAIVWLGSEQAQRIACELDLENSLERWVHAGRPGLCDNRGPGAARSRASQRKP